MSELNPWDDAAAVTESIERVQSRVFERLPSVKRRRRVIRALGAGAAALGLFAGGIAVGAAAYASPLLRSSDNLFFINCYKSPTTTSVWTGINYNNNADDPATDSEVAAAKADPVSPCLTNINRGTVDMAFGFAMSAQYKAGQHCGYLSSPGAASVYFTTFTSNGAIGFQSTNRLPARSLQPNCANIVIPTIKVLTKNQMGACTVDAIHVNVYVLGNRPLATVCARHGLTIWKP